MYEWIEALAYEIEAAGRRAADGRRQSITEAYERGIAHLSATSAGERLAGWVQSFGSVAGQLPVVSWQADLIAARHGIDDLMRKLKEAQPEDPHAGMVAVQLVEALDDVRRERLALRAAVSLVNPAGSALSAAFVAAGRLSAAEPSRVRLLRRGHVLASGHYCENPPYVVLHGLARAYLGAGKPGLALRFSVDAAHAARRGRAADGCPVPTPSLLARLRTGAGAAVHSYAELTPEERQRRRCGEALVTAAWAHLRLDQVQEAREAADAAVQLGNTMGNVTLAASLEATGLSVKQRLALLRKVEACDRREYCGTARGDAGTAWHMAAGQTRKAIRLMSRRSR